MAPSNALHKAADSIEPRLAKALRKAFRTMRTRVGNTVPLEALVLGKSHVAVRFYIDKLDLEDALVPCAEIIEDAVMRGGRIAARTLEVPSS